MYPRFIKPFLDFALGLTLLVVSSPIFIIASFLLFVTNKGKVFFIQSRPGKNEKTFDIIKFRTMNEAKSRDGSLLPDEDRLTTVGKWIRKLSLDEMPQLINVIRGEMSLVGPRPLLLEYIPLYSEKQKRRHKVRPGITGWAQVNGRNLISWEEKFDLDIWYVENISFKTDMLIIGKSVLKILKMEGISSSTSATMEKFTGSPSNE